MEAIPLNQVNLDTMEKKVFTTEEKPKDVRHNNILAAKTLSDIVRTSLGPKGMDKMPEEQRKAILQMMTGLYPGLFEKGNEEDDT